MRALLLTWVLVIVATACAEAPPAAPSVSQLPRAGGQVFEGTTADIRTLFPPLSADLISTRAAQRIYAPLWRADRLTGELLPDLAHWTVSADGLTYSWEIDPRASWSDGRPVTGADFRTTVEAFGRSAKAVRKSNFEDIDGFVAYRDGTATEIAGIADDGKRFSVKFLRAPCAALANVFGPAAAPLPRHVFGRYLVPGAPISIDDAPETNAPPVSSGPFLYERWDRGDQLVLARNPGYFKGPPHVDRYVVKVVPDSTAIALQLRTGELTFGSVNAADLPAIEREPRLRVHRYVAPRYTYIGWNLRSDATPALRDKRVRQALSYGLDLDTFVGSVLGGLAQRVVTHHPPSSWAFPAAGLTPYKYDRGAAETLLGQAGYSRNAEGVLSKDGRPFELTIMSHSGDKGRESLAQVAAEQYAQLGIRVKIQVESFASMTSKLIAGERAAGAWINGWVLGTDPDPFAIWHSSQIPDATARRTGFNFGGFVSPELDAAIEQGRSGTCAVPERRRAYARFNLILNEEQPYNFGFTPLTLVAADRRLQGFAPGGFDEQPEVERWWLSP